MTVSMTHPEKMVIVLATMTINELTDDELAALNLAVQLDADPRRVLGYEKAVSLFTEGNGTRIHDSRQHSPAL